MNVPNELDMFAGKARCLPWSSAPERCFTRLGKNTVAITVVKSFITLTLCGHSHNFIRLISYNFFVACML